MNIKELEEKLFATPAGPQWKEIGVRHHHGICLPLFSLHSEQSCGIGEYLDLIPLIPWCKEVGLDVIQLLPFNDTGLDTSPYNSISAFALNPIHITLSALPGVEKVPEYKEKLGKIRYWTQTSHVKHHIVREMKNIFLREYAALMFDTISKTDDYRAFLNEHRAWVESYALFKSLKDTQSWRSWEDWPNTLKSPSEASYQTLLLEHGSTCDFHTLLQYFCFRQFEKVKQVANEHRLYLKGDLPILISRDSADVWRNRQYFLIRMSAGAPPDMYSKEGQHWGFPLYEWESLEKNGYNWWKERLRIAAKLFHLYRIDHVVGFFRIWAIENGKSAKEGIFLPSKESEWIPHGKKIMEMMLRSSPLLPIGEDLGLVPTEVKQCLYNLGICGTKMMRWERRWETDGGFIPPSEYEPMTMSTVSTHDSDTLQLWWRHFPREAKLFSEFKGWNYQPFLSLQHQQEILRDSHHSNSLFHINLFQEYLALFPELVANNPNQERINIPGKILDINWTYRFKPSIEQILRHVPLKHVMMDIIK